VRFLGSYCHCMASILFTVASCTDDTPVSHLLSTMPGLTMPQRTHLYIIKSIAAASLHARLLLLRVYSCRQQSRVCLPDLRRQ
jgi:hypothetical protein